MTITFLVHQNMPEQSDVAEADGEAVVVEAVEGTDQEEAMGLTSNVMALASDELIHLWLESLVMVSDD